MQDDWRAFQLATGAHLDDDTVRDYGKPELELAAIDANVITDLSFLNVLRITGKDATDFLHGQFTSDIAQLGSGAAQFSAWCNPKGQVAANFIITRHGDEYLLLLPHELKGAFLKRLRLYILRAAVTVEDCESSQQCIGVRYVLPENASCLRDRTVFEDNLVTLPVPGTQDRWIHFGAVPVLIELWQRHAAQCTAVGSHVWHLFDILAGLPWIMAATSETCLPQLLNLDELGGLSYRKGCFPGQEIIARLHYRGKIGHRMFLARLDTATPIQPGVRIHAVNTPHAVGMVINSVTHPRQGLYALVTLEIDHVNPDQLRLADSTARFTVVSPPAYLTLQ